MMLFLLVVITAILLKELKTKYHYEYLKQKNAIIFLFLAEMIGLIIYLYKGLFQEF